MLRQLLAQTPTNNNNNSTATVMLNASTNDAYSGVFINNKDENNLSTNHLNNEKLTLVTANNAPEFVRRIILKNINKLNFFKNFLFKIYFLNCNFLPNLNLLQKNKIKF